LNVGATTASGSSQIAGSTISDFSNVPYDTMNYNQINDPGKTWIRKYGLALSKEILGAVRSKYGTIPIPNSEVTMDGDALRTEAATEKEQLITQLRETLEQTSRRTLTEKDQEESEFLQQKLNKVPIPIFIG
jgi:C4-type Zn-finger protein